MPSQLEKLIARGIVSADSAAAQRAMTHYAPDQASEDVGRRVRQAGQNLYDTWLGPAERLGRAATSGTLDVTNPQTAGDALGLVGSVAGARAPFAEPGTIGSAGGKSITAYHGSPHDFDRFDISKIGTGEGAQAYGHGLYFAESEGVAKDYQRRLAPNTPDRVRPDEKAIADYKPQWDAIVAKRRQAAGPDFRGDTSEYDRQLDALTDQMTKETLERNPDKLKGRMYQVSIKADPEHFLDWDRPLSEQPAMVRKLRSIDHPLMSDALQDFELKNTRGQSIVGMLGQNESGMAKLRAAGIPGIKYLDQGSRVGINRVPAMTQADAEILAQKWRDVGWKNVRVRPNGDRWEAIGDDPNTTRNYVVFDDQMVDILKKYGLAGLVASGAYHYQDGGDGQTQSR